MAEAPKLILKPERETSVLRRHPWIFSGGVARIEGSPAPGATVAVCSSNGRFLAWGQYSPTSQIRARLVCWTLETNPDAEDFWRRRIQRAIAARRPIVGSGETNACRLVHAESDGVPGLIVDRYADGLVVQLLTAGSEPRRALYTALLTELAAPSFIYERSDADVREKEGLAPCQAALQGGEPPAEVEIRENGLRFLVDVRNGHKTGFYLDQRDNRERLRDAIEERLAGDSAPEVLNVFSYTGGFAVYALAAGAAHVVNVDTSADVLALGRRNIAANNLPLDRCEDVHGDAFQALRGLREAGRRFDLIVLDPPKFALSQGDVPRASRGYKDINMQAMRLLRPGGILFTFSCSGSVNPDLFQKIVFGAALDVKRTVQIVGTMTQSSDHPVDLTFPEGAYLKGMLCRVM